MALLRSADVLILHNGSPLSEPDKRMRTHNFVTKGAPPAPSPRRVGPAALLSGYVQNDADVLMLGEYVV